MENGIKERKRRRNRILACCLPLCLCFVILSVTVIPGLLPAGSDRMEMDRDQEGAVETSPDEGKDESPQIDGGVADAEFYDSDNSFVQWNNKTVTSSLWEVLKSATAEEYLNIYLIASIDRQDQSFLYQGKTLKWYSDNTDEKDALIDQLAALPKVGDILKYGDAVYITGTPTGEKWSKQLYEETVAYYGSALLDKYIVNGEFLLDEVVADGEKAITEAELARKEYQQARSEYKKTKLAEMYALLKKQGVNAGISATGNTLMILITKGEFENLKFDNMQEWTFTVKRSSDADMNNNGNIRIPDNDDVIE